MNYSEYLERLTFTEQGKALFSELHEKLAPQLSAARAAYDAGDAAFGEYVSALSAESDFSPEQLTFYLYVRFSETTLARFRALGIPEAVFYSTTADFARNCERNDELYGVYGIRQPVYRAWFRRNLEPCIFRLGRLEFEMIASPEEASEFGLTRGGTAISVHIPKGDGLSEEECESAYNLARGFFARYFGIESCLFVCQSWLLHPWLRAVLPKGSGIIKFQKKFTLLKVVTDYEDVKNWVFPGYEGVPIDELPQNTSLRRAVIEHIKGQKEIGCAFGIRK